MKLFVAGGTGFVGSHLAGELQRRGHQLRLLVHRHKRCNDAASELVEGDVTRLETLEDAVRGCDAIINLVGIIREFPRRGVTFEQLHVQATANLLAVARKQGIMRYLQMSALGTRPDAVSRYHKTKSRAEELVRGSGLSWTILRPSLIFGPGDSFVTMLAGHLRLAPLLPVIGSGAYRLQPIHATDVARCFALALELPCTVAQSFDLCGNDRLSYLELLDTIASALGKPPPLKLHIPLGVVKLIVPALQWSPRFPITMDQLQMLLEENICDCRWKQTFGFEPRGVAEGIRDYLSGREVLDRTRKDVV